MISIDKCKSVNNAPNIIMRSSDRWTGGAKTHGLKHKGLEYYMVRIPIEIYNKAKFYGGNDYWDKDDSKNEEKYDKDPQFRKDLVAWLKTEDRKSYAKVNNRLLGR
jgi:hypothetical protein